MILELRDCVSYCLAIFEVYKIADRELEGLREVAKCLERCKEEAKGNVDSGVGDKEIISS